MAHPLLPVGSYACLDVHWDAEANAPLAAASVPMNYVYEVQWRCPYGHTWMRTPAKQLFTPRCPECGKHPHRKITDEQYAQLVAGRTSIEEAEGVFLAPIPQTLSSDARKRAQEARQREFREVVAPTLMQGADLWERANDLGDPAAAQQAWEAFWITYSYLKDEFEHWVRRKASGSRVSYYSYDMDIADDAWSWIEARDIFRYMQGERASSPLVLEEVLEDEPLDPTNPQHLKKWKNKRIRRYWYLYKRMARREHERGDFEEDGTAQPDDDGWLDYDWRYSIYEGLAAVFADPRMAPKVMVLGFAGLLAGSAKKKSRTSIPFTLLALNLGDLPDVDPFGGDRRNHWRWRDLRTFKAELQRRCDHNPAGVFERFERAAQLQRQVLGDDAPERLEELALAWLHVVDPGATLTDTTESRLRKNRAKIVKNPRYRNAIDGALVVPGVPPILRDWVQRALAHEIPRPIPRPSQLFDRIADHCRTLDERWDPSAGMALMVDYGVLLQHTGLSAPEKVNRLAPTVEALRDRWRTEMLDVLSQRAAPPDTTQPTGEMDWVAWLVMVHGLGAAAHWMGVPYLVQPLVHVAIAAILGGQAPMRRLERHAELVLWKVPPKNGDPVGRVWRGLRDGTLARARRTPLLQSLDAPIPFDLSAPGLRAATTTVVCSVPLGDQLWLDLMDGGARLRTHRPQAGPEWTPAPWDGAWLRYLDEAYCQFPWDGKTIKLRGLRATPGG